MTIPLAPIVRGPIVSSSTHVNVSGVLAGANVTIYSGDDQIGDRRAVRNGRLWVYLYSSLSVGEKITASQDLDGVSSTRSNEAIPVINLPSPIPAPSFASPVTECMNRLLLASLVPGATVTLRLNGMQLASLDAMGTSAWISIDPSLLQPGFVISAIQTVGGVTSTVAYSPPIDIVKEREDLPRPIISNQPLRACDTELLASALVPAGELELTNEGRTQYRTPLAGSCWFRGVYSLQEGTLLARQRLPGCGGESELTEVEVGPADTPDAPLLWRFCPEVRRIAVTGLKPDGVLTLWSRIHNETTETEIGSIGIDSTTEQVDLPKRIGGTGPIMEIVARQTLCGLTSPPGVAGEFTRPGLGAVLPSPPKIVTPLFDCMRAVPVEDLFLGVFVRAISLHSGDPISDFEVHTSSTGRIATWFPLIADDEVQIEQIGCSGPAASQPEQVQPLPSPLPSPTIHKPVRPGDQTVIAGGCLPGARAHLLVDWIEQDSTEQTWTGEAVFHVPKPLKEGQRLWSVQSMCTESSIREGDAVIVTKGRLSIDVSPDSAPGGQATSFEVTARDEETGQFVLGLPVFLGGSHVGVTGTAFGWTPPDSGDSVTGTVRGGEAYRDATFRIEIRPSIEMTLILRPGPVVVPGEVTPSDVTWTLTPLWPGASPLTLKQNTGKLMIPPPPAGEKRVLVHLSLKAHLQGNIGGIIWRPQTISIAGNFSIVTLTGARHSEAALFQYGTADVPVVDGDGIITGWETRLFAKVTRMLAST